MCRSLFFLLSGVLPSVQLDAQETAASQSSTIYGFEQEAPGSAPIGFGFANSEGGRPGSWIVKAVPDAPEGTQVLVQADSDRSGDRFLMAITPHPPLRDGAIAVRCKAIAGERDQACGVVFRYQDASNYYIARANALEDNVRLYHVRDGKRSQIGSWEGEVPRNTWYQLAIEITGDYIRVFFDAKPVLSQRDKTFSQPGAVGLWVKADSVTAFDEVTVTALERQGR